MELEQVLHRENLNRAWRRVVSNGGAPGVDGMPVEALGAYLKEHGPRIREALISGPHAPQPVRRVEIPKPDGKGTRMPGIPTVLDRFIRQAILQVLTPQGDPHFSPSSYGFRPGRSAHDALKAALGHVEAGYGRVVDIDLEKSFDRVSHDVLMARVARRVRDKRLLKLIRAYLNAGIVADGVVQERDEGTPQGGPLSHLPANVLLDEVDRKLERRGHRFVRYADDCNVCVGSQRAGKRVGRLLRKLYAKLKLRVNEAKSAVAPATQRKLLGYSFWRGPTGTVRRRVAPKAMAAMKDRVRGITTRNGGRSIKRVIADLRDYLRGWREYFKLAETPGIFRGLDQWIRHRLRALQLKQWKRGRTIFRELRARGMSKINAAKVAANACRWWKNSAMSLNAALPNRYFDELGLPRLAT